MIQRLKLSLKRVGEPGLFHDSRKDVRLLAKCINEITSKLNEVIDDNNKLRQQLELKTDKG